MNITKSNGTKIKKTSKKQKTVHQYPNLKLGAYKKNRKDKIVYNDVIIYKESDSKFVKDTIKEIISHPINKYKKLRYLVKNVIVKTKNNKDLKILSVKNGIIRGATVS